MKIHKIIMMIAAAGILLAACSPQATAAPTAAAATPQAVITESGPATCSAVSVLPTPGPTEASMFPPPSENDWVMGPDSAAVTFTEYSDFQ